MDTLEEIRHWFERDHFATGQGMVVDAAEDGRAVCSMRLDDSHNNAVGNAQGGVIFTLADFAFAVASNCKGNTVVNMSSTIHFLRPPRGGALRAEATRRNDGRTTCLYEITVTDGEGRLVATASAVGYKQGEAIAR